MFSEDGSYHSSCHWEADRCNWPNCELGDRLLVLEPSRLSGHVDSRVSMVEATVSYRIGVERPTNLLLG